MVMHAFVIVFDYLLDEGRIAITLRADVELHHRPYYYFVRNIRSLRHGSKSAIPDIRLTRKGSAWVHLDSKRPTDLTSSIGKAIDARHAEFGRLP